MKDEELGNGARVVTGGFVITAFVDVVIVLFLMTSSPGFFWSLPLTTTAVGSSSSVTWVLEIFVADVVDGSMISASTGIGGSV